MRRALLVLVALSLALAPAVGAVGVTTASAPADEPARVSGALTALTMLQENNSTSGTNMSLSKTPTPTATPTATATPTPTPVADGADQNEAEEPQGPPSTGDTVRILPVQLEADFVSTEVAKSGETYNTSGPFAFFSISEPVEQAAIQQPGAKATVLEGGRQVKVEYETDAAPVGEQSLYQLELFFSDGSARTVDLYAEKTSVDTGAAEMKKYRPLILDILNDAESNGYERSPQGAEQHYEDTKETAKLLENLLSEKAKRLFGSIVGIATNPLGIAAALLVAALLAWWQISRNGQVLDILSNDSGKSARLRERLWIQFKQDQQTAAEEPLRELRGIGEMGEIYWKDAYGVDTTAGLAELFRQGLPVRRDGEVKHVGGVADLDVETIHSSWLEAVCRDHRLPSVEIGLSHGKTALRRMVSDYGMGHVYDDTYETVVELLDELDESRDVTKYSAESARDLGAGAAPGDD